MAVPSVANINPNSGSTIGYDLLEIIGDGFRVPIIPDTIPAPVQPPTVEVLIGGTLSPKVAVVNEHRLIVLAPPGAEEADADGNVTGVDVIVRNIDDDGDVIPGETATVADAYTYQLPQLHPNTWLQHMVDRLIQVLKDSVHPNVMQSVHTDWDGEPLDGLSITNVGEFPAIVLDGPELSENRFYSTNEWSEEDLEPATLEEFARRREPRTVDVGFDVLILSDNVQEILNLAAAFTKFMHYTKWLKLPASLTPPFDPNDTCDFELDYQPGGDFAWTTEANNSNVRQMRGSILVRGFDVVMGPLMGKGTALGAKNGEPEPVLETLDQLPEDGLVLAVSGAPLKSPPP
jgi:hypothetical protein